RRRRELERSRQEEGHQGRHPRAEGRRSAGRRRGLVQSFLMTGPTLPSGARTTPAARVRARGMTLFEVLIVVVLIALFSSAVLFGSGMLSSNRMNAAAILIV